MEKEFIIHLHCGGDIFECTEGLCVYSKSYDPNVKHICRNCGEEMLPIFDNDNHVQNLITVAEYGINPNRLC